MNGLCGDPSIVPRQRKTSGFRAKGTLGQWARCTNPNDFLFVYSTAMRGNDAMGHDNFDMSRETQDIPQSGDQLYEWRIQACV